jgi:hypothetical protein
MPSKKSRYHNRGPSSPVDINQLRTHLKLFTQEHLIEIIWLSAQYNSVLWRALSASIGMRLAKGNWEETKKVVDYALYFSDFINYTEKGYGVIINEMINALEFLYKESDKKFTLQIANYILERAQEALEYFEDDWDWTCELESLEEWVSNKTVDCL